MVESIQVATHLGPFSSHADRYNLRGYQPALPVEERLRRVARVKGLGGIELNFRGLVDENSAPSIKALLDELGLACVSISQNVWADGKWGLGALTHPDPAVRRDALDILIAGMRTAKVLGSDLVSLWPAQEGFDYPFQVDYAHLTDWFVGGLRECADAVPDVRICIEYKPKEPRAHILTDTAARTMWLLDKVGRANVGVLLDVGHSLYAYENVAQSAVMLMREGRLFLLHWNDNYGEWDWDMIPASVRFWELLELAFWLREYGYSGWHSIDVSVPRGGDPVQTVQLSANNIRRIYQLTAKLDREAILANLKCADALANLRLLSDQVFAALGV